jgi:hypothetical protein
MEPGASADKFQPQRAVQVLPRVSVAAGPKDAGDGTPRRTGRLSLYEAELVALAELSISRLIETWEGKEHHLEAEAKRVELQMRSALEEFLAVHKRHRAKDLREPHRRLPDSCYLPLLVVLGILEFPFNLGAFAFLRVPLEEQILIAAAPSIALVALSHLLATEFRWWPSSESRRWPHTLTMVGSALALGAAPLAVAALRVLYVAWATNSSPDLLLGAAFLAINLLILAGAWVAAFLTHDPDVELEKGVAQTRGARKVLTRVWKEWNRWGSAFNRGRGETAARISAIRNETRALLYEYRLWNLRYRGQGPVPKFFQEAVTEALFRTRDLGREIDLTPPPLDEILAQAEKTLEQEV